MTGLHMAKDSKNYHLVHYICEYLRVFPSSSLPLTWYILFGHLSLGIRSHMFVYVHFKFIGSVFL